MFSNGRSDAAIFHAATYNDAIAVTGGILMPRERNIPTMLLTEDGCLLDYCAVWSSP
jgi:hypothetical protein